MEADGDGGMVDLTMNMRPTGFGFLIVTGTFGFGYLGTFLSSRGYVTASQL